MDTNEETSSDYDEKPTFRRRHYHNPEYVDPNEHYNALEQEGRERMQREQHDNDLRYEA